MVESEFAGKVVVVTGASHGIGAATATAFAGRGAYVCANYPEKDAREHLRSIEDWRNERGIDPERIVPLAADVSAAEQVKDMYSAIRRRFEKIDVLVNNAGIIRDRTVAKLSDQEWRDVLAVNLDGVFFSCRAALPLLRDGGRIINISSMVAHMGGFGIANYAASKAGVLGLTKTLAYELAARRITVNALCPGFVDTAMTRGMPRHVLKRMIERIPLKRMGEVAEVVACIMFLASGKAGYVTGQSLGVNGGFYMGS